MPTASRGEASPALLGGWWELQPRLAPRRQGRRQRTPGAADRPTPPGLTRPKLSPSTEGLHPHSEQVGEKVLVACRRCSALHLYEFPAVACSLSRLVVAVKLTSARAEGERPGHQQGVGWGGGGSLTFGVRQSQV